MTNTPKQHFGFRQKLLAVAMLAAFAPAHAADEDEALGRPESSVSAGLGVASGGDKDKALFGQYNGLRKNSANLLLDADIRQRDNETGTWMIFQGRNLGLDSREFGAVYQKQGDWKLSADYGELVRHDPRTINTNLQNPGSSTPTVMPLAVVGTGSDLNLEQKRKSTTLSGETWLTTNLLFEASFKNEDKSGVRLSGRGIACGVYAFANSTCGPVAAGGATLAATAGAILMLPEPVNSTTKQFEARLNYSGDQLKLSGGYYGSFFSNSNGALSPTIGGLLQPNGLPMANTAVSAGTTLFGLLQQPVALPPDNQAHQFSLTGNYAFTPTTRATFKLAYTHATQNEDFGGMGLTPPAGAGNLGAVVNNKLAQFGLTARPLANLSLNANLRYEDKNDKTAYDQLNPFALSQNSAKKTTAKLEGSYRLPDNYRATFGVDYQSVNRDRALGTAVYTDPGISALREDTKEVGYRAELRRSMSEELNASIGYGQSRRSGGSWLSSTTAGFPATVDAAIANGSVPASKEDRQRNKVKIAADWTPLKALSLQLMLEDGKDRYTAPTDAGLRDTGMRSYGIDAVWTLSDDWKLTGFWNQSTQALHVNHAPALSGYMAELKDVNTSVSVGVVGKPSAKLQVGANLMVMNDSNRYQISSGDLPDASYRLTSLKFFGKYALEPNADIRVDLVHQRAKLDDWTWGYNGIPFVYSDNTSVSLQQNQNVTFLGVTYIYKMK